MRGPAQKCSRFHELSAYKGSMRTCAKKLALQLERRRSRAGGAQGGDVRMQPCDEPNNSRGPRRASESEEEEEEEPPRNNKTHASHERHLEPPAMSPSSSDGLDHDAQPSAPHEPQMAPGWAGAAAPAAGGARGRGRGAVAAHHASSRRARARAAVDSPEGD